MDGSSSTYSSSGSKGIFTGTFGPVAYVEHLLNEYPKALAKVLKEQAKTQQETLRASAKDSGTKWADYADKINVKYHSESGEYQYSVKGGKKVQQEIMALEYGTPQQAPNPLLRTNIISNQHQLGSDMDMQITTKLNKGL